MPASTDTGVPLGQRALFGVTGLSTSTAPVNGAWHTSQALIGVAWPIAGVFYSFDTVWSTHDPELEDFSGVDGRKLHVCWQPSKFNATVLLTAITSGAYDAHIDQMLAGMAAYPYDVIVRWGHEMNGNFARWSAAYTGSFAGCTDPDQYIAAWQHIVTKARSQAPDVKWFFNANGGDIGIYPVEDYYPGDSYVDIVGFDAYNTYSSWGTPFQTWQPMYDRVDALHATAPIWVGETGCKEDASNPGRKAEWVDQMFAETRFDRLEAVNYFDRSGGFDWRFETSQVSLDAFVDGYGGIVNADAIEDGFGVLPLSAEPALPFSPSPLPLQTSSDASDEEKSLVWMDARWHAQHHGDLAYYLGKILTTIGSGNTGLNATGNGYGSSLVAKATGTGTASISIVRILADVFEPTKKALAVRGGGNVYDWWGVRADGQQDWGPGNGATDTTMRRVAAGQLGTGAILFDGVVPGSSPSAGALVYAENNTLKARQTGLGAANLIRRNWETIYTSTHVLNDNPKLASSTVQPPAGFVHLALVILAETKTVTNVLLEVTTAGATLADCYAAVYDSAGTQLGVTADISSSLTSTGIKVLALGTPVTGVTPKKLSVGILFNGTTIPFLRSFPAPGIWSTSSINQPFIRAGGSALTAMPSPLSIGGLSGSTPTAYLCAVS